MFRRALSAILVLTSTRNVVDAQCSPDVLEVSDNIGMKVEKVGSIPAAINTPFSYNMMVFDNFEDRLYFADQMMGQIYSYNPTTNVYTRIFDMATSDVPAGLTLDYPTPSAASAQRIHSMIQGHTPKKVYVVFQSTTLPSGWTEADAKLPPEGAFPGFLCAGTDKVAVRDLYRIGLLPDCSYPFGPPAQPFSTITIYYAFYEYTLENGLLTKPRPFFVSENQLQSGHFGGGVATVNKGRKLLFSTGDCLMFGSDGRYAPQLDTSHCGKMLLIDPSTRGTYRIAAKGVRNSQQMRRINYSKLPQSYNDMLIFMDIGGVTAEEVNGIFLRELVDPQSIENFGWGRSLVDGKAREGTCYVAPGDIAVLGTEPPSEENAPVPEKGFIQPWVQFGRTATDFLYAISGFAVNCRGFDKLSLIMTEFNTGLILGTTSKFNGGKGFREERQYGPAKSFKIRIFDADNNDIELVNGLNDLVDKELTLGGPSRGDPRLFHYPDGTAGAFIERTGVIYRLTEIAL